MKTMKWLLRREFWEHKGAMLWAPIVAGTLLLPQLWADPLGPMMKVWPILALNFVCLAILDDR